MENTYKLPRGRSRFSPSPPNVPLFSAINFTSKLRANIAHTQASMPAKRYPQRRVHIKMGAIDITKGDEVTKSCKWKRETEEALLSVRQDIGKLDDVIKSEKDRVYTRKSDLILGAHANNEDLRATLNDALPEQDKMYGTMRGSNDNLDDFMVEQLEKLAALHPQGHLGVLLRSMKLSSTNAIIDVQGKDMLHGMEKRLTSCIEGVHVHHAPTQDTDEHESIKTKLSNLLPVFNEAKNYTSVSVQCDMENSANHCVAPGSPVIVQPGKVTARNHLSALHQAIATASTLISSIVDLHDGDVMTEDEAVVRWVRSSVSTLSNLGADIPRQAVTAALQELKQSALASITSQTNLAVTQSCVAHLSNCLTMVISASKSSYSFALRPKGVG